MQYRCVNGVKDRCAVEKKRKRTGVRGERQDICVAGRERTGMWKIWKGQVCESAGRGENDRYEGRGGTPGVCERGEERGGRTGVERYDNSRWHSIAIRGKRKRWVQQFCPPCTMAVCVVGSITPGCRKRGKCYKKGW